jgi:hypothetical protein
MGIVPPAAQDERHQEGSPRGGIDAPVHRPARTPGNRSVLGADASTTIAKPADWQGTRPAPAPVSRRTGYDRRTQHLPQQVQTKEQPRRDTPRPDPSPSFTVDRRTLSCLCTHALQFVDHFAGVRAVPRYRLNTP